MAKYTTNVAADRVGGKYNMILIAARRARELNAGWNPTIESDNNNIVKALEEIEAGHIGIDYLDKSQKIEDYELELLEQSQEDESFHNS